LAQLKAEILNDFVRGHQVTSVIEFGCGDGVQLALAEYPRYVGIDVSTKAIELCRTRFKEDPTKNFILFGAQGKETHDLAISLDVIYHLVEDPVFHQYMTALFESAERYVIIYSSNDDAASPDPHVRHRAFGDWIRRHRPDWRLRERIPNRYPYDDRDPGNTSFADFYIYGR